MKNNIQLGKYRHYKGNMYEVIGVAKHSETLEELVVYRALYGSNELWARPIKEFFEEVEVNDLPSHEASARQSKKIPRFELIK